MASNDGKSREVPERYNTGWLAELDSRTAIAREMRGRYSEVCTDLGGVERLSYIQRSLVERALWLEYWLASQERNLAGGGDFDVSRWVQAVNSLQGVYTRLGIERRAKAAPSLSECLNGRASA